MVIDGSHFRLTPKAVLLPAVTCGPFQPGMSTKTGLQRRYLWTLSSGQGPAPPETHHTLTCPSKQICLPSPLPLRIIHSPDCPASSKTAPSVQWTVAPSQTRLPSTPRPPWLCRHFFHWTLSIPHPRGTRGFQWSSSQIPPAAPQAWELRVLRALRHLLQRRVLAPPHDIQERWGPGLFWCHEEGRVMGLEASTVSLQW